MLSEDEGRLWREFLEPTPSWLVTKAFAEWVKTNKFFPTPAEILQLIEVNKGQNRIEFRACEQNGCIDGWVRVFEGKTIGGHPVDPKIGAVVRCKCWSDWSGQ